MFNMTRAHSPKKLADMYDTHKVCIPFDATVYCSVSHGSFTNVEPEEHWQGEHCINGDCYVASQSMLFNFSFTGDAFNFKSNDNSF